MREVDVKAMPLQEKYDQLLESFLLTMATDYALVEELGAVDQYLERHVQARKNVLPRLLGTAFKMFRRISPKKAIEQVITRYAYTQQMYLPKDTIEIHWDSERQVGGTIRHCPHLQKLRTIVKKAGLHIDPRFHCTIEAQVLHALAQEFGLNVTVELEKTGCRFTGTLP